MISDEAPNNPDSRGRKGSFTGEFRTAIPRNPASVKTMIAISFSCSLEIRKIVLTIKRYGIRILIVCSKIGRVKIKIGEIIRMIIIAAALPYVVRVMAS